jgi:hypothetical protein
MHFPQQGVGPASWCIPCSDLLKTFFLCVGYLLVALLPPFENKGHASCYLEVHTSKCATSLLYPRPNLSFGDL